jgi:AcrR family transcriptional regulator
VTENTRIRIVEAALRVLARDGYSATSVKDIAAEAGIAQGLVHYYFKTKEDLVVAALERCCDQLMPSGDVDDPAELIQAGFASARTETPETLALRRVLIEMTGLALHHAPIRDALLRFTRQQRESTRQAIRTMLARRGDLPSDLAYAVGDMIEAALYGIWAFGLLDPEFDGGAAVDTLREVTLRAARNLEQEPG